MAIKNETSGAGVSWAWALATPFILAAAASTVIGIFFLPALCVYLDGRSRTYAGAITLVAGLAVTTYFFGAPALAVFTCVIVPTVAALILRRMKQPFSTGLAVTSIGGVLGMLALLGILGGSSGVPLNETVASYLTNQLASDASNGYPLPLDVFTNLLRLQGQPDLLSMLSGASSVIPPEIQSMSVTDKIAVVKPVLESTIAVLIPSLALAGGMLMGALAYWLPSLMLARRSRKAGEAPEISVPPFASFKVPKYIVVSILLVQIASMFAASSDSVGWITVKWAAEWTLGLMMNAQALSLFSFFLNRKRVSTGLQILIFIPAVLLFSWLLTWVGIFDTLFDLRAALPRMDEVRSKGKQVFTQDGLDELRKMQQARREKKKDDKGEDEKK